MKPRQIITSICAAMALFTACKKDDGSATPSPAPTPSTSNVIDEAKLKNKWELTSYYTLTCNKATDSVLDATGMSQTYHDHDVSQWDVSFTSYMTFNNDNSFDHSNKDGSGGSPILDIYLPKHGKWLLMNGNKAISFEIKPVQGRTTIVYDVVEFKENYMHLIYKDTTTWSDAYDINHLEFKK